MCGIVGFSASDKRVLEKMTDSIRHRGPDAEGFFVDEDVSLGHRRLSIIDLSEKAAQPMLYKDFVIVFNGEIYNFQELRAELEQLGHTFISNSDTEVVLHAYEQWQADCVNRFNGMWAFCIYNKNSKKLFLSRDRFGIKPLYYFFDSQQLVFASELKAIKAFGFDLKINKKALSFFFYQKYIGADLSIFKHVFKLRPAENLEFCLQKKSLKKYFYYDLLKEIREAEKRDLRSRISEIESVLEDAIEKRLIADVPVGSFLSGGLDSSLISAVIAQKKSNFQTFSIGFRDKSYNELEFSKIVAKHINTGHNYEMLEMDESILKKVLATLDEPFGDSSVLPTFLLSKITKKKVTVSLSGDAGDELFGGYDTYWGFKIANLMPEFVVSLLRFFVKFIPSLKKKVSLEFKIKRFLRDFQKNATKRHLNWMATFTEAERKQLLTCEAVSNENLIPTAGNRNQLQDIQVLDVQNYLPEDILKKVDIASMANSLEVRVPFLDYRLVPLVLSLPDRCKIKGFRSKYLLKKIGARFVPKLILKRKKRGFTVPIARWIEKSELVHAYLSEAKYYKHGLLNREYVMQLLGLHLSRKGDYARHLWLVFVFNYWYDKNLVR